MNYKHSTITAWPGARTLSWERRSSPFWSSKLGKIMPLSDTLEMLERELEQLHAKNVVLQTWHAGGDRDITRDGRIRATARRPSDSGVIVSFDCKHGPLSYPCDALNDWESNVRAIAYHLEHVRLAGLYGVGAHGEPYRGFAALPPAPAPGTKTARERAADTICKAAYGEGVLWQQETVLRDPEALQRAVAAAIKRSHPDHGGSRESLEAVMAAKELLR
ncbi:hypothetical protein [Armatimonas sp.]|uniref:hypothetical protein n=1 Tax=Armatimonas sp. TaxID=1872638 RepID=UPI003753C74B